MKAKTLLAKLSLFFDDNIQGKKQEIAALKKLLKQLKAKEKDWQDKLKSLPQGEAFTELEEKILVIHLQRKKGIERLNSLKVSMKK